MAKFLLVTVGSYGDVTPLVGLGAALRGRGHEVVLLTNDQFEPLARSASLGFASLGTVQEYEDALGEPDLWSPRRGFDVLCRRMILPAMERAYDRIMEQYVPGRTAVVATGPMFGARIAHEAARMPLVTLVQQPVWMRSRHEMARGALGPPPWIGSWGRRMLYRAVDAFADRRLAGPVNALRRRLGLPPVRRLLSTWWLSPSRAIGLWPEWFARAQPDWPRQVVLTGFLPYDEPGATVDLGGITRPIVFSPGSAMRHAGDFFRVAMEACRRLGRQGVLITRYPEQLPEALPAFIRHIPYAPLGKLLPGAAAIVHHGGLQTMAQALAAGVPQLVRPTCHDQFDNAHRLARLGVSATLCLGCCRVARVVAELRRLVQSDEVALRCRHYAERCAEGGPMERTCALIEASIADPAGRAVSAGSPAGCA
jgi:rhamnosyltransferase subunit B